MKESKATEIIIGVFEESQEQDCRPFTECWCMSRENHPKCKPAMDINLDLLLIVTAFLIMIFHFRKNIV